MDRGAVSASERAGGKKLRNRSDRLVKLVRLAKVNTMRAANDYLEKEYWPEWNSRFARPLSSVTDLHRPLNGELDLASALSHVEQRRIGNDHIISFAGRRYQISGAHLQTGMKGRNLRVELRLDGSLHGRYEGSYVDIAECGANMPGAASKTAKPAPRKDHNAGGKSKDGGWWVCQVRLCGRRPRKRLRRASPLWPKASARDFTKEWAGKPLGEPKPVPGACRFFGASPSHRPWALHPARPRLSALTIPRESHPASQDRNFSTLPTTVHFALTQESRKRRGMSRTARWGVKNEVRTEEYRPDPRRTNLGSGTHRARASSAASSIRANAALRPWRGLCAKRIHANKARNSRWCNRARSSCCVVLPGPAEVIQAVSELHNGLQHDNHRKRLQLGSRLEVGHEQQFFKKRTFGT